jgi:exonuclease SbcC
MILKSIVLEGIRSYRDETPLPISMGTTLFEGDIASGKSTILYAIEFALFGLGPLKATFLLRNGATRGGVTLVFEADGKEYEVHRSLERKDRGIQQVDCYIKGPDGRASLAAGELKERILQILRFNEPSNPRAQSVIYRYAIFTPQEEMKEIILKDPDDRLQTLRRAFGIEQYKIAVQNSAVVVWKVKERIAVLQGATLDIESVRGKIAQEIQNVKDFSEDVKPLETEESRLNAERKRMKDTLRELESARGRIKQAEERIPLVKRELEGKIEQRDGLARENKRLERKIKEELEPRIRELEGVKEPTDKTKGDLKKELREYRAKKEQGESLKSKLEERITNFDSILKTKVCPVCERKIEPKDFASKSQHLKKEKTTQEQEVEKLGEKIEKVEKLIEELGDYESAQKDLKTLLSQKKEQKDRIGENDISTKQLEPVITSLEQQLKAAEDEVKPLRSLVKQIEDLETEIEEAGEELAKIGREIAGIEEKIRGSRVNREQLEKNLKTKEQQLKIKDSLGEHRIWLTDYLAPTIENIEKHVLTSLNQRFNVQFQKWFQILMEDPDLQVRVDEDFSPVIEREGYEQDFLALSGGEKTSVALAYRLGLNTMVQEVAAGGGANLLILDEPTDGFSKEQLSKVRDVLTELKCPQVILVSHERELEAFADRVYRVERVNGVSRVSPLNNR